MEAAKEVAVEMAKEEIAEVAYERWDEALSMKYSTELNPSLINKFSLELDELVVEEAPPQAEEINLKEAGEGTSIERIPTRNEQLEGQSHPETDVPFVTKIVENAEGEMIEVVVPEFDSVFDVQLPDDMLQASDSTQFGECNKQLKEAIEKNPELAERFTDEQLEQIMDGETPDGYTWHHDAEKGKMQLVDTEIHTKTGHTGGKSIWGGGSINR